MTGTSTVERAARARAALAAAELRTGARTVLPGAVRDAAPGDVASARLRREDAISRDASLLDVPAHGPSSRGLSAHDLSSRGTTSLDVLAPDDASALTSAAASAPASEPRRTSLLTSERPPLPVPPPLTDLMPDGLRRGATTSVLGSTSLALGVLAHACASGAWAVAVGQPRLGLLAAAQAGVDLGRFALVPDPGADAALVLAALIDGIDVVLVGPGTPLADADRRRLSARARERGAALLTTTPWPGAAVVLDAGPARWSGVGAGDGRLRTCEVQVRRTGRGSAAVPTSTDVVLPFAPPGEHVPRGPVRRRPRTAGGLRLVG